MHVLKSLIEFNVKLSCYCNLNNLGGFGIQIEYLRLVALLFPAPDIKRVINIAAGSMFLRYWLRARALCSCKFLCPLYARNELATGRS
jgi:hypothetical protein